VRAPSSNAPSSNAPSPSASSAAPQPSGPAPAGEPPTSGVVELSVVLPCLNEAETLATCIRKAMRSFATLGVVGEVVVADNGSTDGSQDIARAEGAVVVDVLRRGYGAALIAGIRASRGGFVLMADADDSYALDDLGGFLRELRAGADLVMGNRFRGRIEPGAMPFLHRYVGNPALSMLGRLFFHIPVGDFHCGIRAFRRDRVLELGLVTSGMEFASEMVVRASLAELRIREVPTVLRPTAGRAPRTCAPGATAGATCASCSRSARAGSCSTRPCCSRPSVWPGSSGCSSGRGRWAGSCSTSTACSPSPRCSCSACRGSGWR
jgi:hypothetical protein